VLAAWCRGEDVSSFDFGDAESIPDRIVVKFDAMTVTTGDVAKAFDVPLSTASVSLRRLAQRGLVERQSRGRWYVKRAAHRVTEERG
jgi:predicted transcriptional regulator of viral defense system